MFSFYVIIYVIKKKNQIFCQWQLHHKYIQNYGNTLVQGPVLTVNLFISMPIINTFAIY